MTVKGESMHKRFTYRRGMIAILTVVGMAVPTQMVWAQIGFGPANSGAKQFTLSNEVGQNQITFVSSAPLEEIHGTASEISGTLSFIPGSADSLHGRVEVDVRSMRTGISKRDGHLISKDWLDADSFPSITFTIRSLNDVVHASGDPARSTLNATAVGEFSLHGVTLPISIPVEATYIVESAQTRKRALGDFLLVKGSFEVSLEDYEVSGARGIVGKRVGKVIQVEAQFFASSAATEPGGSGGE